ncbi:vesicle transport protein USE1 [Petromyzon marinus]|uniref:vesicle transport protein USE1 n=1 Tax=Petromyzon marinus TaxID=7757 RepID=UPI003F6F93AD
MSGGRLHINFVRLLARCESLVADNRAHDWRLDKYIGALQDQLAELKRQASKPSPELLKEYTTKVEFLKGLLLAEKLPTASEKALAAQLLAPGRTPTTPNEVTPTSKTAHLQASARYHGEMRDELLGCTTHEFGNGVRKRTAGRATDNQPADIDAVLQHHNNMQEKLADEMLLLARNLKNTSLIAHNIIQQDNKTMTQSLKMADVNYEKLKVESERLEQHTKRAANWWIWIMLVVVCFIFITMILFIRIFPKPR